MTEPKRKNDNDDDLQENQDDFKDFAILLRYVEVLRERIGVEAFFFIIFVLNFYFFFKITIHKMKLNIEKNLNIVLKRS